MAEHDAQLQRAAAAWPQLQLDPTAFAAYLATHDAADRSGDALAELYLAHGCCQGDPTALALFDAHYLDAVPAALAHMRLAPDSVDEVRQVVRSKLLVAPAGERPKLDHYAGQGRLKGLIKVMAVREAISRLRRDAKVEPGGHDLLADLPSPDLDPELYVMKERYRVAFKRAFEETVSGLSSRDRNMLRLHLFGGLTVEQIGDIYGVHRATATRWMTKLRLDLLRGTRTLLQERIGASPDELESVMRLIESRLDASIERVLQQSDEG